MVLYLLASAEISRFVINDSLMIFYFVDKTKLSNYADDATYVTETKIDTFINIVDGSKKMILKRILINVNC